MNKFFVLCLLAVAMPCHAEPFVYDPMECAQLGGKMQANQFAMTVGELDTLSLCAKTLATAKVQSAQDEKEAKLYERLQGKEHL